MASVEFEHITKRFNDVEVVHDINLKIEDREFLVLVGPSGCGKSTCLQMIAGLEQATEGTIRIGGQAVNKLEPRERDIAMVFQNYALYPHMNVYDNMAFGLRLRGVAEEQIARKVQEAAEILGLQNLLKRKPKELSGGQRQRVALGRAIVRDPKVFLMDEPLSNLDAKLRVQMRAEIARLHQRVQTTFVYVTHDQTEAMTMGDRIALLNGGKIQQIGTPNELYERPANKFVAGFIGSPAMNFFEGVGVEQSSGLRLRLGGAGVLPVPDALAGRLEPYVGRTVTLGIRPEHIQASLAHHGTGERRADDQSLLVKVDVAEHLGNELIVYGTLAETSIAARLDARSHLRPGDEVVLSFAMEHAHIFDPETEVCITSLPLEAVVEPAPPQPVSNAAPQLSAEEKAARRARLLRRNRWMRYGVWAAALLAIILILNFIPTPPPEAATAAPPSPLKGDTIDGLPCQQHITAAYQAQAHLWLYVNGVDLKMIPGNIGRQAPGCTYWITTSATNGVIQIRAPRQQEFTLKQFFGIWGQELSKDTVADCTPLIGSIVVFTYDPSLPHTTDKTDPNKGWKIYPTAQIQQIALTNLLDIAIFCGITAGQSPTLPDYWFKQGGSGAGT